MKNLIIKLFGIIGLVVVIGFVIVVSSITFAHSFNGLANTDTFIAAFMGAFLTFILVKLADLGSHFRKLEKNNLDAMITETHDLNDNLNKLHNNDFVAKDILNTLSKSKQDKSAALKVNFNYFKAIPIDRSRIVHLKNNLYLNELFGYFADIEKLNDSMNTVQAFYNTLITSKLSGQLDDKSYDFNIDVIESKIKEIRKFIKAATDKTVILIAKAQLLLKYRSPWWRLVIWFKPSEDYKPKIKDELEETIQAAWKQIHQTAEEDTKNIQEIVNSEID